MNSLAAKVGLLLTALLAMSGCAQPVAEEVGAGEQDARSEVLFWHFWGGEDGKVVDEVVRRFNDSQEQYRVRAVSMPGNNLSPKAMPSSRQVASILCSGVRDHNEYSD